MFDFDGVIADSFDEQCRACVGTLRARGLADLATRAHFLDYTETNWFAAPAAPGVLVDVVEELDDACGAIPSPELFPETAAVSERLAAAHPVIVATSSRTSNAAPGRALGRRPSSRRSTRRSPRPWWNPLRAASSAWPCTCACRSVPAARRSR